MIYSKIYFTLIFVTLIIAGVKRSDLWFKISEINWITLSVMLIGGALTSIWY